MDPSVNASVDLAVPPMFAFDFLADPTTASLIDPAVTAYLPDTSPMRVGTAVSIRMRVWGLPIRAASVVRTWEPGRRMVMEGTRPTRPVRVTAEHRFEPSPLGCTYTWTITCAASNVLARPLARLLARFWRANAQAQQVNVKREVEQRWRAASRD